MVDGMDKDQFLNFRMALLPASGFQSAQYRMIEINATNFTQLVDKSKREELKDATIEEKFEFLYFSLNSYFLGPEEVLRLFASLQALFMCMPLSYKASGFV